MSFLECRMKSINFYIESGRSESVVICTLGYPSRYKLRQWQLNMESARQQFSIGDSCLGRIALYLWLKNRIPFKATIQST